MTSDCDPVLMHSVCVCVCVRTLVEQILKDTTDDLRAQCCRVERAFSQRCEQLTEARSQLEMKLEEVSRQDSPQPSPPHLLDAPFALSYHLL